LKTALVSPAEISTSNAFSISNDAVPAVLGCDLRPAVRAAEVGAGDRSLSAPQPPGELIEGAA
jgi:hypothetical protein